MTEPVTCYMCDKLSTSREHVPPQCFFPGSKDSLSGKDFRKNLLTVPSCDIHNSKKSGDDLYLLHMISFAYQCNAEGLHLFSKRIRKTAKSRPYLLKTFFDDAKSAYVKGQHTLAFGLDMQRFENGFICMANAIYYSHYHKKWNEPLEILSPSLRFTDSVPKYDESNSFLSTKVELYDAGAQKFGENQEVFFYQFIEGDLPEHKLIRMVFYGGFVVLAVPKKRKEYLLKRKNASAS